MAQAETILVELSGEAATRVREALKSGRYDSPAEVVSDALRDWHTEGEELDINHLKALWEEAERGAGPGLDPGPVNARLREKFFRANLGFAK